MLQTVELNKDWELNIDFSNVEVRGDLSKGRFSAGVGKRAWLGGLTAREGRGIGTVNTDKSHSACRTWG